MARTPGYILPTEYETKEALESDLRRRDVAAGFTRFEPSEFIEEEPLEHFGVKGMKWGRRKTDSDSGGSDKPKMSTAKKVAIGAGVIGGAAIAAYILSQRGQTKVSPFSKYTPKPSVMDRLEKAKSAKLSDMEKIRPNMNKVHYFDAKKNTWAPQSPLKKHPSNTHLFDREKSRVASIFERDKRERDGIFARAARERSQIFENSARERKKVFDDADEIRRKLQDPNHVWEL